MKNKKSKNIFYMFLVIAGLVIITFGFMGDDKTGNKPNHPLYKLNSINQSGKQGDAYRMNINNINLPLNRKGIIAAVNIGEGGPGGQFAGHVFLFSSGFFLSGNANGQPWANAVASASLVEDYVHGTIAGGQGDPNAVIYVIKSTDEPFGQSWQDWVDAVNLGADFYDGDGDGIYNPVDDKDGDGEWDPDEDHPDLIGDELAWCIYSDGLPSSQRRWNTVSQLGIEIKQSVFAFASAGAIGNLVFVRYRFTYVGGDNFLYGNPDELTDVYFGVWADVDLGQADDDAVGTDVPRNSGYTYNPNDDDLYGNRPPCYMIDFFSGPVEYIPGETFIDVNGNGEYDDGVDTPLDTAKSVRGQLMGVIEFPGAKNLPISSLVEYINGDPSLRDPSNKEEARNYMLGRDRVGDILDPCTFSHGNPGFAGCETTDPLFWFSGDPVGGTGWITSDEEDVRQMSNTGPFTLERNVEKEIVVAYVVGQGSNPLDAITVARKIDDGAQNIFDLNFLAPSPPPPVQPTLTSSDDFIDIVWETPDQINYSSLSPTWDLRFHSYKVYAFKTNITADVVSGEQNSTLLATYQVDNFITNLYKENAETGGIEILYPESPAENKLDVETYGEDATGRLRLRVYEDPFSPGNPIIKGTPYYFAIVGSAINYDALIFRSDPTAPIGEDGEYYLSAEAFAQESENPRTINWIVVGDNAFNPPVEVQPANQISGASNGEVGFDVIDNTALESATYEVTFFKDSSSAQYSTFWMLENLTTSETWDSNTSYTYGLANVNDVVTEGFITKVEEQVATIDEVSYLPEDAIWYSDFDSASVTGIWYVGTDIPQSAKVPTFNEKLGDYTFADRLRTIELRFGANGVGKAYRYINAYKGIPAANNYTFAHAITSSDTSGKGVIGNWDETNDRPNGFVDVPFTAWVVDERYGEEYQLAVGFVERRNTSIYPLGNPDGVWDPDTTLRASGEVIVIFDRPYDPNGGHIELTGGDFSTPGGTETVWAGLINGPDMPADAQGVTEEQRAIFSSNWFNTMYVVGLERINETSFYTDGDILTIPLDVYPYTESDVYQFTTIGRTLSEEGERALFEKVNVFPNPLYGFNTLTGFDGTNPDDPFVTFTNLPTDITIKIFSLSGTLLRTITPDPISPSPFLRWNLENESGLRVASGLYLAIVTSAKFGEKILKFSIILPQKQIPRF